MIWRGLIAAGLTAGLSGPVHAESWTCTYPGYDSARTPVILRYVLNGGTLTEKINFGTMPWTVPYKVLVDDSFAVIAVSTFSEKDAGNQYAELEAVTVIIDKENNKFLRSDALMSEKQSSPLQRQGTCLKD